MQSMRAETPLKVRPRFHLAPRTRPITPKGRWDTGNDKEMRCASCTRPLAGECAASRLCAACLPGNKEPATTELPSPQLPSPQAEGILYLLAPVPPSSLLEQARRSLKATPTLMLCTSPCLEGASDSEIDGATDTDSSETAKIAAWSETPTAKKATAKESRNSSPVNVESQLRDDRDFDEQQAERAARWALYRRAIALYGPPGSTSPRTLRRRTAEAAEKVEVETQEVEAETQEVDTETQEVEADTLEVEVETQAQSQEAVALPAPPMPLGCGFAEHLLARISEEMSAALGEGSPGVQLAPAVTRQLLLKRSAGELLEIMDVTTTLQQAVLDAISAGL